MTDNTQMDMQTTDTRTDKLTGTQQTDRYADNTLTGKYTTKENRPSGTHQTDVKSVNKKI